MLIIRRRFVYSITCFHQDATLKKALTELRKEERNIIFYSMRNLISHMIQILGDIQVIEI